MAHIVELREMSDDQLEERLENLREEMFNLRFQQASARLEDTTRLRHVRREIAQIKEVLHKRSLAVSAAAEQPEIQDAISGKKWQAQARYIYQDTVWEVTFQDGNGKEIATAQVDLNQKHSKGKKKSKPKTGKALVKSYEVTG